MAVDGHEERGDFSFTVAAADAESPNTATLPPDDDPLSRLGSLVLIVAAAIGVRRALRSAT